MRYLCRFIVFVGVGQLISSTLHAQNALKELRWRGCGVSKIAFMEACATAYEAETGVKVRLTGGGATLGIEAVAGKNADLGGTCRACLTALNENKLEIRLSVVAWDALAVIVHKDNPVKSISREQLRKVLKQEIRNWNELDGGLNERILVVARRGKTSGVGYSTRLLIFGDVNADYGRRVIRLRSSGPVEELVERQRRSIAITGISSAQKRDVKVLPVDGVMPSVENIATGKYPYFRPLYIGFRPDKNDETTKFVEWLLGPKGQAVVAGQHTVNLKDGAKLGGLYSHFENPKQIVNLEEVKALANEKEPKLPK